MNIIAQGAEAIIYREGDIILKERVQKAYRIKDVDVPLRRSRTRRETKVIQTLARAGIPVPRLFSSDDTTMVLSMEFVEGPRLRDKLAEAPQQYGVTLGHMIGRMHAQDVIHGDLTTSNVLVSPHGLVLIDFGLSFFSKKDEDKAVDLHVLCQTLRAHRRGVSETVWKAVVEGYTNSNAASASVLARLEKVELRGRNKLK